MVKAKLDENKGKVDAAITAYFQTETSAQISKKAKEFASLKGNITKGLANTKLTTEEQQLLSIQQETLAKNCAAPEEKIDELQGSINDDMAAGGDGYTQAIRNLNQLQDEKQGIAWHVNADNVLIRDTRGRNGTPPDDSISYQILFLNLVRASQSITGKSGPDPLVAEFMEKAKEKGASKKLYQEYQKKLVIDVARKQGCSWEEASKILNEAKDYVALQDDHLHVVTISSVVHNGQMRIKYKSATLVTELTQDQKIDYENIKNYPLAFAILNKNSPTYKKELKSLKEQLPEWFVALKDYEQDLLLKHVDKILDGKHGIPTQLRKILGARNAYMQETGYVDNQVKKATTRIPHSGALVAFGKAEKGVRQKMADKNAGQLKEAIGVKPIFVTLNTQRTIARQKTSKDDYEIVTQANNAAKAIGALHDNRGLNVVGQASENINGGSEAALYAISLKLNTVKSPLVAKYLASGKAEDLRHARKQIEDIFIQMQADNKSPQQIIDTITMLGAAVHLKQLLVEEQNKTWWQKNSTAVSNFFNGGDNNNLAINSTLAILANKINLGEIDPGILPADVINNLKIMPIFECASGKDRTQLQLTDFVAKQEVLESKVYGLEASALTMEMLDVNFTSENDRKQLVEVLIDQANDGHSQILAGMNCGTPGCRGLKNDTISAMSAFYGKVVETLLFRKTAGNNKVHFDKIFSRTERLMCFFKLDKLVMFIEGLFPSPPANDNKRATPVHKAPQKAVVVKSEVAPVVVIKKKELKPVLIYEDNTVSEGGQKAAGAQPLTGQKLGGDTIYRYGDKKEIGLIIDTSGPKHNLTIMGKFNGYVEVPVKGEDVSQIVTIKEGTVIAGNEKGIVGISRPTLPSAGPSSLGKQPIVAQEP